MRRVLAHHLIWTGYGHWLPNDPRGSGSREIVKDELRNLGPVHSGRKQKQPSHMNVQAFYVLAEERLAHPRLEFTNSMIAMIGQAFAETIRNRNYTCYACAVLPDHAHLVIRAHRDHAEIMIAELQRCSRLKLYKQDAIPCDHPV